MSAIFDFDAPRYLELIVSINDRFARALDRLKAASDPSHGHLAAEEFALHVRMICESILAE